MASLLEKIKANQKLVDKPTTDTLVNVGGQLQTVSGEELANLSKLSNQPIPTSPQEASVIGGNPDQAKMSGSSANLQNALRQSIRESSDLSTAQRRATPRTEMTAEEKARKQQLVALEGLGSLQARVQQIANGLLSGPAATGAEVKLTINTAKVKELIPNASQDVLAAIDKIASGSGTSGDLLLVNNALGKTTTEEQISIDQVKQLFLQHSDQTGASIAGQLQDQISLKDFTDADINSLGFQTRDEMAQAIGLTSGEELNNLTVDEFQSKLGQYQRENYRQTQDLLDDLADPNLGPAERAEAQRLLSELGLSGVRSVEEGMENLQAQVEKADQVKFNGEELTISEILSDDLVKATAKQYLEEPNSPFADSLRKNEPALVKWIEANKLALENVVKDIETDLADFQTIQEDNKKLAKLDDTLEIPSSVMQKLIPKWGKLSAERFSPPPFLTSLQTSGLDTLDKNALVQQLEKLPEARVAEIASLTTEEIDELGLLRPGKLAEYNQYVEQTNLINQLDNPDQNPEAFLKALFGTTDGVAVKQLINDTYALNQSGFGEIDESLSSLIDKDRDGKIDDLKGIRDLFLREAARDGQALSLKQLLSEGRDVGRVGQDTLQLFNTVAFGVSRASSGLVGQLGIAELYKDGKMDTKDAETLVSRINSSYTQPTEALRVLTEVSSKAKNVDSGATQSLEGAINSAAKAVFEENYDINGTYNWLMDGGVDNWEEIKGISDAESTVMMRLIESIDKDISNTNNPKFSAYANTLKGMIRSTLHVRAQISRFDAANIEKNRLKEAIKIIDINDTEARARVQAQIDSVSNQADEIGASIRFHRAKITDLREAIKNGTV